MHKRFVYCALKQSFKTICLLSRQENGHNDSIVDKFNTNYHQGLIIHLSLEIPLKTHYSKVEESTLFFCLHVYWPLLLCFKPNIPLNSADGIDRGNKGQLTMRQKSNEFSAILE